MNCRGLKAPLLSCNFPFFATRNDHRFATLFVQARTAVRLFEAGSAEHIFTLVTHVKNVKLATTTFADHWINLFLSGCFSSVACKQCAA